MERIDHVETAIGLLPQHMRKPKIEALLTALLAPAQPLEDTLIELELRYVISHATTYLLDWIGKLVNFPRNGVDDDTYRRYLYGRLASLRSKGTAENLIAIVDLVFSDAPKTFHIRTEVNAVSHVYMIDEPVTEEALAVLLTLLRAAVAGGVRLILDYALSPYAELFRFDAGPGFDQGKLAGAAS